ncbi:hypothetical protein ANCCEY_05859 [Ancylostoma ceylanicum]|uniref:Uncharacterized protein n=1 Tax=Ancylostoma ceylanicum TaxID=53326 RepID=A0A0D6LT33_9BILA|nr:hypothetical protein ANCCEY_05859 [Ancylostoma ceylanicum]
MIKLFKDLFASQACNESSCRFYSKVGHELNLRSLRELCIAMTSASENRIFYSGKKAPALTPATNLLTRVSNCKNHKLQVDCLGWKTLFGTFRAVRTSEVDDASVHWTVLDVIGAYLRIDKYSVLSWSLPDCLPCIIHFLQSSHSKTAEKQEEETDASSKPVEDQLSEAALRLVTPTYTVILNLFKTPHIANPNLLHRYVVPLTFVCLSTACFCLSTLLLPHVQKWVRRGESGKADNGRSDANLRQAVGICTQMVVDTLTLEQSESAS